MPVEHFKSAEAYRRWNAYRHMHGIRAPHLREVCVGKKCHKVKHSKKKSRVRIDAKQRKKVKRKRH